MSCLSVSFALTLSAASQAEASDWWLVNDGLSNLKASSDADSLVCSRGKCTIWEKTLYSDVRPDKVSYQTDLARYDCVGFKTATLEERSFAANGALIKVAKAPTVEWQPVAEDTLGEALLTFACTYKANMTSAKATGVIEIDQRQFLRQAVAPARAGEGLSAPIVGSRKAMPLVPDTNQMISILPGVLGVQIVAADRMAIAQAALDRLKKERASTLGQLRVGVEPVVLNGKTAYRAMISNFSSVDKAIAFCRDLKGAGYDCFVRRPVR